MSIGVGGKNCEGYIITYWNTICSDFFIYLQLNENVNAFQRKFVTEVRRCDEMERKLRYIEAEVKKDGVNIPDVQESPKAPNPREIIDLEVSSCLRILHWVCDYF